MSDSKIKFRESLGRYVQVLHDQGVRHVSLDRQAREAVFRSPPRTQAKREAPPAPAPVRASAPAPGSAAVSEIAPAPVPQGGGKPDRLARLEAQVRKDLAAQPLPTFRNNVVFGEGNPDAAILFIGEAPGADEDRQGRPFVGRAGQLLTKMIQAMGLERSQVYIANILKCRPDMPPGVSGNRKPTPEEMGIGLPHLLAQIEIIEPKAIVALGATAVEALLESPLSISRLRGRFADFRGIPLMPTFHPSYLLHNPTNATKRKVWEDLMQVMDKVGMPISAKQKGFFLS